MNLNKKIYLKDMLNSVCNADRRKLLAGFFICSLIVNMVYLKVRGVGEIWGSIESNMDSGFFISGARMFISDIPEFFRTYGSMPYYWFYMIFLGLYIAVFGESYTVLSVIQMTLLSASVPVLYLAAEKITEDKRIRFMAAFMYTFCFTSIRWGRLVSSDFLATSFMTVCLYFLFSCFQKSKGVQKFPKSGKSIVFLSAALLIYFTMRTNAVVFIIGVLILIIWRSGKKARIIAGSAVLVCALSAAAVLLFLGRNEMHSVSDNLGYFGSLYREGIIVGAKYNYSGISHMEYGTPGYYLSCLAIVFYRLFYYWTSVDLAGLGGFFAPTFEYVLLHDFLNLFVFLPMFLGMITAKFKKDEEAANIRALSGLIWLMCIVQIFTEIQQDWRYRDIIMPMAIIVGSYGAIRFYDMLKADNRRSEHTGEE